MNPRIQLREGCRLLVTGGAGFIGSHVVDELLLRGCRVDVLDDFSTGRESNLSHSSSRLQVTTGSVTDSALVARLTREADCVVHLAAVVGALSVHRHQVRTMDVNIDGTRTVLTAAAENHTPVLVASSSEVYGPAAAVPCREDDLRVVAPVSVPRACYGISKAVGEQIALAFTGHSGVPVIVPRLFNTIGNRQHSLYGMVVPSFMVQALNHEMLTIFGDGSQTRCFVDVEDVVKALLGLLECPDAYGRVINVGATREVTVLELAQMILQLTGRQAADPSAIGFVPHEEIFGRGFTDISRRVPSIDLLHRLIGWSPRISLEESLRRVLKSVSRDL